MTGRAGVVTRIELPSLAHTDRLGSRLAALLEPGDVVLLAGELGSGKTTLVKAVVGALGSNEVVTSPTFTLVRTYATIPPVAHVDCWRLEQLWEVLDLGLEEVLDRGGVALVEWGEAAVPVLGQHALRLTLEVVPSDGAEVSTARVAELEAPDAIWANRLAHLDIGVTR